MYGFRDRDQSKQFSIPGRIVLKERQSRVLPNPRFPMKATLPLLKDESCHFAADEVFFSTTDARGVITSGNEVFVRISGYQAEELIGRAHNVVRHPDMPRSAFRLVWSFLKAGKPVAALVKNRAKDGRYYWVVALIAPTAEGGYLSVRFKPTGRLFAAVQGLYAEMVAEERRVRETAGDENAAMAAGEAVLTAYLQGSGRPDYETFMQELLCEELKARDETLLREKRRIIRTIAGQPGGARAGSHLVALYGDGCRAYEHLNVLYRRLDDFVAVHAALENKSSFVNNLTRELRLASMNVALASSRLGSGGAGLGVISHYMGASSVEVAAAVRILSDGIHTVSARLRAVIFNLAAARLQIEMVLGFIHELVVAPPAAEQRQQRHALVHTLHGAFAAALGRASEALHELEERAVGLNATSTDLGRHMLGLEVAQLGGVIESTRLVEQEKFGAVFAEIRGQIERTHRELSGLSDALERLGSLAKETPIIAREIETAAERMETDLAELAA